MLTAEFNNKVYSEKLSSKIMDTNRHCVRRVVPHKEAEFSSQSIMKAMEKFVEAVQEMDQTILVPVRLMDLEVGEDSKGLTNSAVKRDGTLSSTDLYRLYSMVNSVKNELLWGSEGPEEPVTQVKGHARRPSSVSVTSTNSGSNISDTDSVENDSGIEGEPEPGPTYTQRLEDNFRRHLAGLHKSLNTMTEAATYLTRRYQSDIGGPA